MGAFLERAGLCRRAGERLRAFEVFHCWLSVSARPMRVTHRLMSPVSPWDRNASMAHKVMEAGI